MSACWPLFGPPPVNVKFCRHLPGRGRDNLMLLLAAFGARGSSCPLSGYHAAKMKRCNELS